MIRIGIIGYGYWGPNIVRNLTRIPSVKLTWVSDLNPKLLKSVNRLYSGVKTTKNAQDIFSDSLTNAVIIATPVSTHFDLALSALTHNKHVLVEKPMTMTSNESQKLIDLAKKNHRILMVDHTFVYTPAISKIKTLIDRGTLGNIYYVDSIRTNLGLFQKDSNVIYDLATHDFSIIDYLIGEIPISVRALGIMPHQTGQEQMAHISCEYNKKLFVHVHVSWLSPIKTRSMTLIGTKKMLVYDDTQPSEKIKIYDKGVSITSDPGAIQLKIGYRTGSIIAPHLPVVEGLTSVTAKFISAIKSGKSPITDGRAGERVVRIIEAASVSMKRNGQPIMLKSGV